MKTQIISDSIPARLLKAFRHAARAVVATIVLSLGSVAYGQMYHYEFSINGITDGGAAKEITDILRPKFNTEADPFEYFPAFDDDADNFIFDSAIMVQELDFENFLVNNNLELLTWHMTMD